MRTIANVLWLLLSGLWLALSYAILGVIVCLGVVTVPLGKQLLKLAAYALWPFGRAVVKGEGHSGTSTLGNVLWLIPGLLLVFSHLLTAAALAVGTALTLFLVAPITLPLIWGNLKMVPMALAPFGREVVDAGRVVVLRPGQEVTAIARDDLPAAAGPRARGRR